VKKKELHRENRLQDNYKMADRANDDRAVRPLPVFNGAMAGIRKNGDDGDSYAVWRAHLIINLRAKRLLSIVSGDNDDDESEEEDNQPSARRRQVGSTLSAP
jgi:hypothetical protein